MITNPAPVEAPECEILSFAEESCYTKDEKFRQSRSPVRFRLTSVSRKLGRRIDVEFVSDYGIYYDSTDDYLLSALAEAAPDVRWSEQIFHRFPDQSRINVLDSASGKVVAQIATMKYGGRPVGEKSVGRGEYGENVVSLRAARERMSIKTGD